MTFQRETFRSYFLNVLNGKQTSFNTYSSYLKRIDALLGGIDEEVAKQGAEGVRSWAIVESSEPFASHRSQSKAVLNSYLNFLEHGDSAQPAEDPAEDVPDAEEYYFRLEAEMQAAVRKDITSLEPGLTIVDDGIERQVSTGRIDITARDKDGRLVAIELKARACPPGAIEQALGYAEALAAEEGSDTRAILIASDFTIRQRAAAKRVNGLALRTYKISLSYAAVE